MQFSKVAVVSAISGSALASWSNSTITDIQTKTLTITSCSEDKCSLKTIETGILTVTELDTTYTTYCPLPSTSEAPESTKKDIESTTVTITSCHEDKCVTKPVVTGLTTVTEGTTVYTTYCPLTSTEEAPASTPAPAPETESSVPAPGPAPTVSKTTVAEQSSAAPSSAAPTVVEGSAAKAVPALAGLLALGAFI
ncbi:PGA62 [Candida pseudojiufengensis]|uniref:PGA62 n=1 Tax=Candida pseudojiufengensis TaxID=497109 RepID=UPI002225556D|nr:PGA62 [Candida pseudojiufengensis]KAI5959417.1 PGA62 [Candida pseudojiufengensis]